MKHAVSLAASPELIATPHPEGLGALLALIDGERKPLPLAAITVRAVIAGDCCRTVIEQRFHNPHAGPIEAIHLFPLPEDGAVVELELRSGDVTVRAECRERAAAEAIFHEAREQGHTAALLTAERADVHTLRVTRIPPGADVTARIVVVERLDKADGRYHWRFPTVIPQRYLPGTPIGHDGPSALPATDHVPDADRLQPPLRLNGGTLLDLEVSVAGPVRQLACSQHAFQVDLDDDGVRVAPSPSTTLNKDFALSFSTGEAEPVVARGWTDGQHTLVVVEPPTRSMPAALPRDAVFVVDISGSMGGAKMRAAQQALTAALHGLMPGDRFMLIAFDDKLERFENDFCRYNQSALSRAERWVAALEARGGTKMLPAIQAALAGDTPEGRVRTVLFITDGQAWNEAELTAAVANRRGVGRFFTFGIDTAVNGALLKRLARVGGGTCELATPSDDIEGAMANLEARFGSPILDDVHVEGRQAARLTREALFTGRAASILVEGDGPLTVVGRGVDGEVRYEVTPARTELALGALWGRDRVAALEDRLVLKPFEEEALRPALLEVALAYGIASRFTAFVAVDRSKTVGGELVEVVQPAELPEGWVDSSRAEASPSPMRASAPFVPPPSAPPPPAPRPPMSKQAAPRAIPAPPAPSEPGLQLALSQDADGSYGRDTARTAAALVALVLLGHTRRKGSRRRAVLKAAQWLQNDVSAIARRALTLLDAAEAGEPLTRDWPELVNAGTEGALLARVLAS